MIMHPMMARETMGLKGSADPPPKKGHAEFKVTDNDPELLPVLESAGHPGKFGNPPGSHLSMAEQMKDLRCYITIMLKL